MHGGDGRTGDARSSVATPADYVPWLRDVSLANFMAGPRKPLAFAVERILPRGTTTLLTGHGGSLKTTVALTMIAHWACGRPYAGFGPGRPLRMLFVSLEDPAVVLIYLLRKITKEFNLDPVLIATNVRILDGSDSDGALAVEDNEFGVRRLVFTALLEEVEEAAMGRDVVVIDGASDAFAGDENSRRQVRAFLRRLTQMARASNAANMLIAHIDKQAARHGGNGQNYSGSTAWHNSARGRMALLWDGDKLILRFEKGNRGPPIEDVTIRVNEDGVPVPSTAATSAAQTADDLRAVMVLMRAAQDSGVAVLAATLGGHTGWHATRHLPEAKPFADSRQRFYAALEAAARSRDVVRVDETDRHRNTRAVWKLPEASQALAQMDAARTQLPSPDGVKGALNGVRVIPPHTPRLDARTRAGDARVHASKDRDTH